MLFNPRWVIIRFCWSKLFEVHNYSLSLSLFDTCLFYGIPFVRISVLFLHVCTHVGLFCFTLRSRVFSLVEILYIYEIATKTTIDCVCANKQIAALTVLDIIVFLLIPRLHQQVIDSTNFCIMIILMLSHIYN